MVDLELPRLSPMATYLFGLVTGLLTAYIKHWLSDIFKKKQDKRSERNGKKSK